MRLENKFMTRRTDIDELAEKISLEIERLGACSLQNQELAVIWGQACGMPYMENKLHLANFSIQYGFIHRSDEESGIVSFSKLD